MVEYLSASELYSINEAVLGERPYVRDRHLLLSAARRPTMSLFGEEQFPTILDKAAALLQSLAYHHPFGDGNKRTATIALGRFLRQNGFEPLWDETTIADFVLHVAQGGVDVPEIAGWLSQQTQPR